MAQDEIGADTDPARQNQETGENLQQAPAQQPLMPALEISPEADGVQMQQAPDVAGPALQTPIPPAITTPVPVRPALPRFNTPQNVPLPVLTAPAPGPIAPVLPPAAPAPPSNYIFS
ncbi:MAG: hypothetical protein HY758_05590 [Nitrospirae bacterium]|nr:hypothetical protein [Nitrospirota bacterium]